MIVERKDYYRLSPSSLHRKTVRNHFFQHFSVIDLIDITKNIYMLLTSKQKSLFKLI